MSERTRVTLRGQEDVTPSDRRLRSRVFASSRSSEVHRRLHALVKEDVKRFPKNVRAMFLRAKTLGVQPPSGAPAS